MSNQDVYDLLPKGVQRIVQEKFKDYMRGHFEATMSECHNEQADNFIDNMWDEWNAHVEAQWQEYQAQMGDNMWIEFLSGYLDDDELNTEAI